MLWLILNEINIIIVINVFFSEMKITVTPKSKPQTSTHQRATDIQAGQSQGIYNNMYKMLSKKLLEKNQTNKLWFSIYKYFH